jgi:hypothetical protein
MGRGRALAPPIAGGESPARRSWATSALLRGLVRALSDHDDETMLRLIEEVLRAREQAALLLLDVNWEFFTEMWALAVSVLGPEHAECLRLTSSTAVIRRQLEAYEPFGVRNGRWVE